MSGRKSIPKHIRQKVYEKYNGHCAYCGCELDYKDMQVDHINPVYWHNGENSIENYNPSCRMCNFYKSTYTVEKFRENLHTLHERLEKSFIYRLAKKYGIVTEHSEKVEFYFEKCDKRKNQKNFCLTANRKEYICVANTAKMILTRKKISL